MIRVTALLLTLVTGFTGLVYEVAWQKSLAALLGSHAEATAAVLAIFLGGLAAGYALFGRMTRRVVERARQQSRPARLLYLYALVEMGIGLYALAFPTLFSVAQYVSLLVPHGHPGLGFAFDVVLSTLLIGPPTVLMGGTIPILTLALAGDLAHATRVHAWIYGTNTLGAFAGALAGGFFLVPMLGLDGVVYSMGCVNLVAAALFAQLDRRAPRLVSDLEQPAVAGPAATFVAFSAVALLGGFAMMAIQTSFNRVGALALGASQFTFAMVVAVFVLCIALGSLAVSALGRIPRGLLAGSQWALVGLLLLLYLGVADVPYWAHASRVMFRQVDPAFYAYHLFVFGAAFAVLVVPIGLSGALLPLLFHELRRELGNLGSVAGRLYAWNTVGSLLGALLGGYVLLFWLDLHHVYRIAVTAVALGAAILTLLALRGSPRILAGLLLLPTLAAIWLLPAWSPDRLAVGLFRGRQPKPFSFVGPDEFFRRAGASRVLSYDDDPTSTVTVIEPPQAPENRSISVNGKSDGALEADYPTMALTALLPALMAEQHESSFVIGWGTGVTAGELAALDETRAVRVAEISPGVIAAAPFFEAGNLGASKSPKVSLRRGDAYRSLLQSPDRYDLILSEPSNPWVTGVEMLYSLEFLTAARERLAPGGVYAQWFHLYESDPEVVALVLRTYAAVFPRVSVWYALGSDLLLLGFDRPDRALDVDALEERFKRPDFRAGFARAGIESFPQLLTHELLPLGTLHATESEGDIHTLRHPILSYMAARAFFVGRQAWLPPYVSEAHQRVATRNSLLRRLGEDRGVLSEETLDAAVRELCSSNRREACATLFARWGFDHPDSARLETALAEMRKSVGGKNPHLAPASLGRLRMLYGRQLPVAKEGTSLAQAERVTSRFLQHYHHAVPFNRDLLEAAWSRCQGERCGKRRRLAEQRLGGLDGRPGKRAASVGRNPARGPGTASPARDAQTTTVPETQRVTRPRPRE
jgi:spermidine synthase